jgi:hypothetical protein
LLGCNKRLLEENANISFCPALPDQSVALTPREHSETTGTLTAPGTSNVYAVRHVILTERSNWVETAPKIPHFE